MQNSTDYVTDVLPSDDIAQRMYSARLLTQTQLETYTAKKDDKVTTKWKSLYLLQCVSGARSVHKFCELLDASDHMKEIAAYIRGQIQKERG